MRLGIVGFVVLLGCSADKPPEQAGVQPEPVFSERKPDPERPPSEDLPAGASHDLGGIVVTYLEDGRITIAGTNKWGRPADETYSSEQYFRDAIPTIARTLTPEQAAALHALVTRDAP